VFGDGIRNPDVVKPVHGDRPGKRNAGERHARILHSAGVLGDGAEIIVANPEIAQGIEGDAGRLADPGTTQKRKPNILPVPASHSDAEHFDIPMSRVSGIPPVPKSWTRGE